MLTVNSPTVELEFRRLHIEFAYLQSWAFSDILYTEQEGITMKKKYTTVYRIKMKEFDYRILISAMSAYRQKQIANGEDTTQINKLLLKVLDAYGV